MSKKEQLIDFMIEIYVRVLDELGLMDEPVKAPIRQQLEKDFKDCSERGAGLFLKIFHNPIGRMLISLHIHITILNDLRKLSKGFRKLAKEISHLNEHI